MATKKYVQGRTKVKGVMNGLEKRYAALLDEKLRSGEILWWKYEGLKFNLAKGSTYTPDFAIQMADGVMECHETKGYWHPNGRTKIKIAANMFPFKFVGVRWIQKEWVYEEFGPEELDENGD